MKLANQSIKYVSVPLFFIIGIWSTISYFNIFKEIKDSTDEELENYKRHIVSSAQVDSTILSSNDYQKAFYRVHLISEQKALKAKDRYIDTIMYMQDADDTKPEKEPVRMLITTFEYHGDYYELHVFNSLLEEDDLVKALVKDGITLYLLLIISLFIVNNFTLKKIWKPFYSLLQQLETYKMGKKNTPIIISTKTDEFTDLKDSLNRLLNNAENDYALQKQFIGNASHELQTPLAITNNKLELMLENQTYTDQQASEIGEILQINQRLIQLNKSLLLLTKIENKQFVEIQDINVTEMLHNALSEIKDFIDYKNILLDYNIQKKFHFNADPYLIHIIFSNLLRNAIHHNIDNGKILIHISDRKIAISNTGAIGTLEKDKIFTRFYKDTQNSQSSGLGLAIVKAICDLYQISIHYNKEGDLHSFLLTFPKTL